MITIDTSGLLAAVDTADPFHDEAMRVFEADRGPVLVPAGILAEAAYVIENRVGAASLVAFVRDIEDGALKFDCGERDFGRIRDLITKYADLPLGLADAAVVACAERHGGRILTFDVRDFTVVGREGTVQIVSATGHQ